MADAFQVLAEPRRREVLRLVSERERTAGEIAERFDVTRQAVSQHLRILLEDVRAYLEAMWPPALARLKAAAEREHASKARDAGHK